MALKKQSLFLYNFEVTQFNSSLDFRAAAFGPIKLATLRFGFYSLTALMTEIKRAMQLADPVNTYTVTADRTFVGGTQNRVTIQTGGAYLDLLFLTGPRVASSIGPLLGFAAVDQTGATSYQGTLTAGVTLIPDLVGYSYLGPDFFRIAFGAVNISASGEKEAIVFQIQRFFQVEFRYEPEAKVISQWALLWDWMIQQKLLEFTPDITVPTVFYECTLETSSGDGKGMGFKMEEMLPNFPFLYKTGMMKFRQRVPPGGFI